jgi:hypothetical protein
MGCSLVQGVLPPVKNDYGTEYETWALNGLEEPLKNTIVIISVGIFSLSAQDNNIMENGSN